MTARRLLGLSRRGFVAVAGLLAVAVALSSTTSVSARLTAGLTQTPHSGWKYDVVVGSSGSGSGANGGSAAQSVSGGVGAGYFYPRDGSEGRRVPTVPWASTLASSKSPDKLATYVVPNAESGQSILASTVTTDGGLILVTAETSSGQVWMARISTPDLSEVWSAPLALPFAVNSDNVQQFSVDYVAVWYNRIIVTCAMDGYASYVMAFPVGGSATVDSAVPLKPVWTQSWPQMLATTPGGQLPYLEDIASNNSVVVLVRDSARMFLVASATGQVIAPIALGIQDTTFIGIVPASSKVQESLAIIAYNTRPAKGVSVGYIEAHSMVTGAMVWQTQFPEVSGAGTIDRATGLLYVLVVGLGGPSAVDIVTLDGSTGAKLVVVPEPTGQVTNSNSMRLLLLSHDASTLYCFVHAWGEVGLEASGDDESLYSLYYAPLKLQSNPASPGVAGPIIHTGNDAYFPDANSKGGGLFAPSVQYTFVSADGGDVAYVVEMSTDTTSISGEAKGVDVAAFDLATGNNLWKQQVSVKRPSAGSNNDGASASYEQLTNLLVSSDGSIVLFTETTLQSFGTEAKSVLEIIALVLGGVSGAVSALLSCVNWIKSKNDDGGYVSLDSGNCCGIGACVCLLVIASILCTGATTGLGVYAQLQAGHKVDGLVDQLANIPAFRQQHLMPACTTTSPSQFNLTELCYCTGLYWPNPQLHESSCEWNPDMTMPSCDAILSSTCGCNTAFQAFQCSRSISVSGQCQPSYEPLTGELNSVIQSAFSACSDHYDLLQKLMWIQLYLHIGLSVMLSLIGMIHTAVPKVTLAKFGTVCKTLSHASSMTLWVIVYMMYDKGAVCTTVTAATTTSSSGVAVPVVSSGTLLGSGIPGCTWTPGTNWPTLEAELLQAIYTAVFVHLSKPIMYGVMMLADCCACKFVNDN